MEGGASSPDIKIQNILISTEGTGKFIARLNPQYNLQEDLVPLEKTIEGLVRYAQSQMDDPQAITRLVTEEFSFFTTKPFTLAEFQEFQKKIVGLASSAPPNLHLVLASFAVLNEPPSGVMNVVAHVECGQTPKVNYIVKNTVAEDVDPKYAKDASNRWPYLIESKKGDLPKAIEVNEQAYKITHDSVVACEVGGKRLFTCIDICNDHNSSTALKHLKNLVKSGLPVSENDVCSHIITSHTNPLSEKNCIVAAENVIHVDWDACKGAEKVLAKTDQLDKQIPEFCRSKKGRVEKKQPEIACKLSECQVKEIKEHIAKNKKSEQEITPIVPEKDESEVTPEQWGEKLAEVQKQFETLPSESLSVQPKGNTVLLSNPLVPKQESPPTSTQQLGVPSVDTTILKGNEESKDTKKSSNLRSSK